MLGKDDLGEVELVQVAAPNKDSNRRLNFIAMKALQQLGITDYKKFTGVDKNPLLPLFVEAYRLGRESHNR